MATEEEELTTVTMLLHLEGAIRVRLIKGGLLETTSGGSRPGELQW